MYPILFQIGKLEIKTLGAFIALGAVAGGLLYYFLAKKRALKTDHIFDSVLYIILIGLVVGRIVYYFTYPEKIANFWQVIYFWQGGLIALPAIFAGLITSIIIIKRHGEPIWKTLDIIALAALLGWSIGKVGCHLSTCSVGKPWTGFLSIGGYYPVDLLSSLWALALFLTMLAIWVWSKRLIEGVVFFLSIEGLLIGELILKTLKSDFGSKNLSQTEAVAYLITIVVVYLIFWAMHGPRLPIRFPFKKKKEDFL